MDGGSPPAVRKLHGRARCPEQHAVGRRPGLYGRGQELGLALQHLRGGAAAGHGRIIAVRGISGMGLTAFTNEIAEQARRSGFAVGAVGALDPRSSRDLLPAYVSPAYSTLLAAFTSPVAPLLPPEAFAELGGLHERPVWLVDRIASLLKVKAQTEPVLIVIDDVQWADQGSRYALMTLPSMLKLERISWLLTSRAGDSLLEDICCAAHAGPPQLDVELSPLSDGAVQDLARDTLRRDWGPGLSRMIDGAGGRGGLLVRFLDLVAREGTAGSEDEPASPVGHEVLPASFVACLRGQLTADLTESTHTVLLAASILGEFTIDDLAAVVKRNPHAVVSDLETLVRGGYLRDHGDRLRFSLELVRAGAYASVPESSRHFTHRLAVQHLQESGRRATEAAPHILATAQAGDMVAVDLLYRAANEEYDHAAAVDLLSHARALLGRQHPLQTTLSTSLVDRLSRAKMHRRAIAEFDRCCAARQPTPALFVSVAPSLWEHGLHTRMVEIGSRALADEPSLLERARVEAVLEAAEVYLGVRSPRPAGRPGRAMGSVGREPATVHVPDGLASAWHMRALGWDALVKGRAAQAAAFFAREGQERGAAVLDEFRALLELDDLAEADAWLRNAADTTTGVAPVSASELRLGVAQYHLAAGALDQAAENASRCLRAADPDDHRHLVTAALDVQARVALLTGAGEDARDIVAAINEEDFHAPTASAACLLPAITELVHGSGEGAVKLVKEAMELSPHALDSRANLITAQRILSAAGPDAELAQCLLDLARGRAQEGGHTARAVANYVQGMLEKDRRLLTSAVEGLASSSRPVLRALVAEDFGRVLLAAGDRNRGITELDRAWDLYTTLGADGAAESVRRVLRSAGVRRKRWAPEPARATHGWDSLTEAELRIALLVAGGLSNRDVGGELVISPNTVATHLRAVYAKLGINKRVQLTRLVLERQPSRAR